MSEGSEDKRPRVAVTHDAGYNIDAYLRAVERAGGDRGGGDGGKRRLHARFRRAVDQRRAWMWIRRCTGKRGPQRPTIRIAIATAWKRGCCGRRWTNDKPVLAICRGLQLFNVAQGGTLLQHIEGIARRSGKIGAVAHGAGGPGKPAGGAVRREEVPVNSRHHQAVGEVSPGGDGNGGRGRRDDRGVGAPGLKISRWPCSGIRKNMAESDPAQQQLFDGLIAAARAAER